MLNWFTTLLTYDESGELSEEIPVLITVSDKLLKKLDDAKCYITTNDYSSVTVDVMTADEKRLTLIALNKDLALARELERFINVRAVVDNLGKGGVSVTFRFDYEMPIPASEPWITTLPTTGTTLPIGEDVQTIDGHRFIAGEEFTDTIDNPDTGKWVSSRLIERGHPECAAFMEKRIKERQIELIIMM